MVPYGAHSAYARGVDAPSRATVAAEGDAAGTSETEWRGPARWDDVPEFDLEVNRVERLLVVAAHPGDEALGAGGLISAADARNIDIHVVLLTAGEASHPDSPTHSARMLASARQAEFRDGLAELAPIATTTFVGLADGQVEAGQHLVLEVLVDLIGMQGESTLVVAPWRHDGHRDHVAAGRAAALAAGRTDAQLLEYPVWLWHQGSPDTAPWHQFQQLPLAPHVRARKAAAIAHHCTQTRPLSPAAGDEVAMDEAFLRHFERDREVFVVSATLVRPALPTRAGPRDLVEPPWSAIAPWYEQHGQDVLLASLPRHHFTRGLLIGGMDGLAETLGRRCAEVLVAGRSSDPHGTVIANRPGMAPARRSGIRRAAKRTKERRGKAAEPTLLRLNLLDEWPAGQFDLVLLSESGYTLSPRLLRETVTRIRECLTDDGVLALGHWRHRIPGWPLSGDTVHDLVIERVGLHVVAQHRERDLIVDVLSRADGEAVGGW